MNRRTTGFALALLLLCGSVPAAEGPLPARVASFDSVLITGPEVSEALVRFLADREVARVVGRAFVRHLMLTRRAEELGLTVGAEEVRARRQAWEAEAGGPEALRAEMARQGQRWCRIDASVRDALLIEGITRRQREAAGEGELSEEELQNMAVTLHKDFRPEFHGVRAAVVATVGGSDYTREDLLRFVVARMRPGVIRAQVDAYVAHRRLLHEAEARGALPTDLDLEKAESLMRQRLSRQNRQRAGSLHMTLEGLVAMQGLTMEELRQSVEFRAQAALLRMLSPKLTDRALAAFYKETKEEYLVLRAAHILAPVEPGKPMVPHGPDAPGWEQARERIDAVHAALQNVEGYPEVPAAVFERLAREHSGCPSAPQGGDIGFLARSAALARALPPRAYNLDLLRRGEGEAVSPIRAPHPDFIAVAYSLRDGEVSGPVRTPYGYHLIRRTETRRPSSWQALREVLHEQRLGRLSLELHRELQEKYPVTYHWDLIADAAGDAPTAEGVPAVTPSPGRAPSAPRR
jgi:hypothetical protein